METDLKGIEKISERHTTTATNEKTVAIIYFRSYKEKRYRKIFMNEKYLYCHHSHKIIKYFNQNL